jgi:hypothetical protein
LPDQHITFAEYQLDHLERLQCADDAR